MKKMNSCVKFALYSVGLLGGMLSNVGAEPIQWQVKDGGNGHYYERFDISVNWGEAKKLAQAMGGYLATITSAEEDKWVFENVGGIHYWLGGTDALVEGEWTWVTGEKWIYDNWAPGQPDNASGEQHFLIYWDKFPSEWDDGIRNAEVAVGFIVEYETIAKQCSFEPSELQNSIATLSPSMKLHIPQLEYQTGSGVMSLWADLQVVPSDDSKILFEVINYGNYSQ